MSYTERLERTKDDYPFDLWVERYNHGLEQYTEENVNAAKSIIDRLIASLFEMGESASEAEKVDCFRVAVELLNELNDEIDGCLIETGEREELCELFDVIAQHLG